MVSGLSQSIPDEMPALVSEFRNSCASCSAWTILVIMFLGWIAPWFMAGTNELYELGILFPAGLLGMGILAIYDFGQASQFICILITSWLKAKQHTFCIRASHPWCPSAHPSWLSSTPSTGYSVMSMVALRTSGLLWACWSRHTVQCRMILRWMQRNRRA